MKTIYCIAYKDASGNGVDQFDSTDERTKMVGKTGGTDEVMFEIQVPVNADDDDIEDAIDQAFQLARGITVKTAV